jgi:lysozyme
VPIRRSLVVASMMRHEGLRLTPYLDTVGKLTIGYGRNLDDRGISPQEAAFLLDNDVADGTAEALRAFAWLLRMDEVRSAVIVEMVTSIGLPRFLTFKRCIAACASGDYETAARELLDSDWRVQVGPTRSQRLAEQLRTGRVRAA